MKAQRASATVWRPWLLAAGLSGSLALAALTLLAPSSNASAAQPAGPVAADPPGAARAVFAGGCFWCVESDFDKVPGVLRTTSGYTGGQLPDPTYEQVSSNKTGHAEVVEVVYDPKKVSYEQLVTYFWRTIDPTVTNRQFCDVGSPYRSAIYAQDDAQLKAAQASKAALEANKPFKEPIVTEVALGGVFYPAESYHQDYYKKNPVRYKYYRHSCGREARLKQLWGEAAGVFPVSR